MISFLRHCPQSTDKLASSLRSIRVLPRFARLRIHHLPSLRHIRTPATCSGTLVFWGYSSSQWSSGICESTSRRRPPKCFHYLEKGALEVEAIVQTNDGRWAPFKVKLTEGRADKGARNLLRVAERVDPERMGEEAALGVIVGSGYGYAREDGVSVIPLGVSGRENDGTCHHGPPARSLNNAIIHSPSSLNRRRNRRLALRACRIPFAKR